MISIRTFYLRLKGLFQKKQVENDLAEELQFHLQKEIRKNVEAGMTSEEARYAALRTFGGVEQVKEDCRDVRGIRLIEEFRQDLAYGLRMLRRSPGFAAIAILTLALAIGADTTIFSVVDAVLLRPLPYPNPSQITLIWTDNPKLQIDLHDLPPTNADVVDWRNQNHVFAALAAFLPNPSNLSGQTDSERVGCASVTADFFAVLGVTPIQGRTFTSEEEQQGKNHVAVISYNLWQRRFGADPQLIGKSVALNGVDFTVVGIMPPGFHFPRKSDFPYPYTFLAQTDIWVPLDYGPREWANRASRNLIVVARLKPQVTLSQAQAEMNAIAQRQAEDFPESNAGWIVKLVPLKEHLVGRTRLALWVLFGAVSCVLFIACANVANLLLARAAVRQREIAIRTALGAGRGRIIRQLITENVLLAILGGSLGLMLAYSGLDILLALAPQNMPRAEAIGIDGWMVGFALLLSLATAVLVGLGPAGQVSKFNLYGSLKQAGSAATAGLKHLHIRRILVVAEVALAFVLLVSAVLLTESFWRLMKVNTGFNPEMVLTLNVALPESKYRDESQMNLFQEQVLERLGSLPEVSSVGTVLTLPLASPGYSGVFSIEEQSPTQSERGASKQIVSADYLRAMGIPLLRGRYFDATDTEQGPPAAIISESLARSVWPDGDPLGKRIGPEISGREWHSIVGVVGDTKRDRLEEKSMPTIYVPYRQALIPFFKKDMTFVVRTRSSVSSVVSSIRHEIQAVDKDIPVFGIQTMEQIVSRSISEPRFNMLLLVSFAALAVLLATIGIYGVMSYVTAQRTHEIGVRMALGAERRHIMGMVLREGMALALIGLGIGLAGAFAVTRILSSLLYEINARDPLTFVAVSLLVVFVALSACYIPARRATRLDPIIVIRSE